MNHALEEVLATVRTLPEQDKEELTRILISDLGEEWDEEVRSAWISEARSRYDAYQKGETSASPIAEVAARVRARLIR